MFAEFRHLDGAHAGRVHLVRKEFATIGRHSSADIRFDSDRDLDVSGRHTAIFRHDDRWMARDLGSTNGTWVNGVRLRADHPLVEGDVLQFGPAGPRLTFRHAVDAPAAEAPATVPATRTGSALPGDSVHAPLRVPAARAPRPAGTTTRVRHQVRRRTTSVRRAAMASLVLAVVALGVVGWSRLQLRRVVSAERGRLLARTDSLLVRLEGAATDIAMLRGELDRARQETTTLRASIAGARTAAGLDSLGRMLAARFVRQDGAIRAAAFDRSPVAAADSGAVAVVLAEFPGGVRVLGSGFTIRVRGDTGWLVTARHLVVDSLGRPARRVGVILNGSAQYFRAELAGLADSADLALLTVRIRGGMPALRGPGSDAAPGDPAAILGFPLGLDPPGGGDWRSLGVRASRFTAAIEGERAGRLELDGYGIHGSSGSPVLNAAGDVIGVVVGGDSASGGRRLYAAPGRAVAALLRGPAGAAPPAR